MLVLLIPGIVGAAPATKLSMKRFDSTNLHIANNMGAMHWDEDTTVDLELRANGKVAASAAGMRKDHNLYASSAGSYYTDDTTTWKTTWTGTFQRASDTLVMNLVLGADTCSRIKTTHDDAHTVPDEKLACNAAAKQTTVTCSTTQIEMSDPSTHKPVKVDAWSCSPSDTLGESPPWLFGKNRCIRVGGGHKTSLSYAPC
jgi:hypothetical protein